MKDNKIGSEETKILGEMMGIGSGSVSLSRNVTLTTLFLNCGFLEMFSVRNPANQ